MFINKGFTINGVDSDTINVVGAFIVRPDGENATEQLIGQKSIRQSKGVFHGVDFKNIEFTLYLTFGRDAKINLENNKMIGKLFGGDRFVPFKSDEYPGYMFYVMATDIQIVKSGNYQGWFEITIETAHPHAWTVPEDDVHDLSGIASPTDIVINNPSNVMDEIMGEYAYSPKMTIQLASGTTNFTLTNKSDGNAIFGMTDLVASETLLIENKERRITSSENAARISKLTNKKWFRLVEGDNTITVSSPMILTVHKQFPVYI